MESGLQWPEGPIENYGLEFGFRSIESSHLVFKKEIAPVLLNGSRSLEPTSD